MIKKYNIISICLIYLFTFIAIKPATANELGDKIVKYANRFVGTPYDRIPIGLYVQEKKLIIDDEIDCMYLVFRVVPLALANGDDKKAKDIACDMMFHNKCLFDDKGLISNYPNRFDYSEDMIASGKWGKSIFNKKEKSIMQGSRMYKNFYYIKIDDIIKKQNLQKKIHNGDIVFFYKYPERRSKAQEAIAHLGILEVDKQTNNVYLIHASGNKCFKEECWKAKQGEVKKVPFYDYLKEKNKIFAGVDVVRISK